MPRSAAELEAFKDELRNTRRGVIVWYLDADDRVQQAGFASFVERQGVEPVLTLDNGGQVVVALEDAFATEADAEAESRNRRPPPSPVIGPHGGIPQ